MKTRYTFHTVLLIALLLGGLFHFSACTSDSKRAETQISVSTPPRPAGQTDVVGLTCEPIETVRIGFIGLGARGTEAIRRFTYQKGIQVKALCDLNQFRVDSCQNMLSRANMPEATTYYGSEDVWKQVCERDDIDLIYIATDWIHHAPMMIYAMEHGKHVACEVPAAMTLDEIWKVIDTAERTRKHCMMLENCVYDFFEITTLNMAQQGLFGNITHVKGAYNHCLYDIWPDYNADWRMQYNMAHRGDVYPTHGMGPACQLLDIHRGDRMKYLVAMDSDPVSLPDYLDKHGRTEDAKSRLMEQYKDPIIKDMEERAKEVGGHGGMDFIMDSRLIYCLHNGLPLDMDVYDLAEWCSLIPLTKLSIENGSVPVEVPDFTRGAWNKIQGYRHAFAQ